MRSGSVVVVRRLLALVALAACAAAACRPDWGGPPPERAAGPSAAPSAAAPPPPPRPREGLGELPSLRTPLPTTGVPLIILSPDVRKRLVQRSLGGETALVALRAACDRLLGGRVEWPDGKDGVDPPDIGEGYQGSDYFHAVVTLGLCHRVAADGGGGDARAYGAKGVEVLGRMSASDGPHAVNPLRDSGYGIRFYGAGMALGYDWLRDVLSRDDKARIVRALDRWLSSYEKDGFGASHPQGNYFAGYYAAKAFAALAVEPDDPLGAAWWKDWLGRVHGTMVGPYYQKFMAGGGWPEGWHYGNLATINMTLPALAIQSAKAMRLETFRFPEEQAQNLVHFSWPSRLTLDDRGAQKVGKSPSAASAGLFTVMSGVLGMRGAAFAPTFHGYAREVRSLSDAGQIDPWQEALFWDERAPEQDYKKLPLSYATTGMNTVAARSSWATDAVWASFTSGTYVNFPGSGEMSFDQGSLVIVKGGQPFLVNPEPTLLRRTSEAVDPSKFEEGIYGENFGNNDADPKLGNRTLSNVFFSRARRYGQAAYEESGGAKTHLGLMEEGGAYVAFRGDRIEDMYRRDPATDRPNVVKWSRQVVFVRPGTFVVDDRTTVARPDADQWMSFHFCGRPAAGSEGRLDVACDGRHVGSVTPLLPRGAKTSVTDVFSGQRVFRLETRPGAPGATQRWIHVLDAASPRGSGGARPLSGAEEPGGAVGALLERPAGDAVVASAWTPQGPSAEVRYAVPERDGLHVITDLEPRAKLRVEVTKRAGALAIAVRRGEGSAASPGGVLAFRLVAGTVRAP